jgi:hypothetical protein
MFQKFLNHIFAILSKAIKNFQPTHVGGFQSSFSASFRRESRNGYKSLKIKRETMPEISHKGLFALKKQNRFSV